MVFSISPTVYKICIYLLSTEGAKSMKVLEVEGDRMIWVDLEMTGLDVDTCKIMEVACLVTDADLNIIAEGPDLIIHQPSEVLENMNEWCIKQHGKTGLTEASRKSNITITEAENIIVNFIQEHTQPKLSPLAGSSILHDRIFIKKFMPRVEEHLHYRIVDVSTIKELCRRWNPVVYKKTPKKVFMHRALSDIKESINELKWYKQNFMKVL